MDDRKSKEGRDSDSPAAGPTSIFLGKEHKQVDWLVCLFATVSLCVYLLLRLRNCVCLSCFYFLRAIHPRPICLPISVSVTGFVFVRLPHLSLCLLIYLTVSASSCLSSCVYVTLPLSLPHLQFLCIPGSVSPLSDALSTIPAAATRSADGGAFKVDRLPN